MLGHGGDAICQFWMRSVSIRVAFGLNYACILNPFGMHSDFIRYAFGTSVKFLFVFEVHSECVRNSHSEFSPNAHRVHKESIPIWNQILTVLTAKILIFWSRLHIKQYEWKPNSYRMHIEYIQTPIRIFLIPESVTNISCSTKKSANSPNRLRIDEIVQNANRTPRISARMKTECKQNGIWVAFGLHSGLDLAMCDRVIRKRSVGVVATAALCGFT